MGRWALGLLAALAVLAAAVLGMTTRSLGLDLVAQREVNDRLQRTLEERDQALAALDRDVERLRNLVETLQIRQAPDVLSFIAVPAPAADGVVSAERVRFRLAAGGAVTHVIFMFHPDPPPEGSASVPLPVDAGAPPEGVPASPSFVVGVDRDADDGWSLTWQLPEGAAGRVYAQACNGPYCSFGPQPSIQVRHPGVAATD